MSLDKLKATARQHEHREEWSAAIELYREAIRASEAGTEGADPSLYNRVGDISHKAGLDESACEAWGQAAARYGEQGFFNNAIALCGKILRLDPHRVETYFELARYHARKRVLYDVRQNLTLYRDQMAERGKGENALTSLSAFGREFQAWREVKGLLDELLGRTSEAAETASADAAAERMRGLVFLDTDAVRGPLQVESSSEVAFAGEVPVASPVETDMVLETTQIVELETPSAEMSATLDGLEPTAGEELRPEAAAPPDDLVDLDKTKAEIQGEPSLEGLSSAEFIVPTEAPGIVLDGLESTSFEAPPAEEASAAPVEDLSPEVVDPEIRLDSASTSESAPAPAAAPSQEAPGDLIYLDTSTGAPDGPESPGDVGGAEGGEAPAASIDASSIDPLGDRVTASALLEHGDRAGGIAALERALAGYLEQEDWPAAYRVASDLITAEPSSSARHQARVEVAAKWGDRPHLTEAYVALGEAFQRLNAPDKAVAVFRRALELDELNAAARDALRAMVAPKDETPNPEGYIDFGAMVNDDVGPRSTRMRTETAPISPDEDETFREALAEFKRALDQNLPIEDHQTHYDLGVAFREMGLLDEAVGEFQKALRSVEGRLRTAEALGQTFFEQGRPAVAEAVLKSVERGNEGDADKIGVLYWLGRALEAQGKGSEARGCYDRVLAVDVSFHDVVDRVTALSGGGDA